MQSRNDSGHLAKRRRRTGPDARSCPHCGRSFKRTEHLERHVRTHTKEKPFVCHCGAAFARRDLLTRHQRVSFHDEGFHGSPKDSSEALSEHETEHNDEIEPAEESGLVTAVPLPVRGLGPWEPAQAGSRPPADLYQVPVSIPVPAQANNTSLVDTAYHQPLLSTQIFDQESAGIDAHFREFATFLDGVGLPTEWSPYFDRDYEVVDPTLRVSRAATATPGLGPRTRPGSPFSSWLPSAPTGNRIPGTLPEENPRATELESQPYRVSVEVHARLIVCLESFRDVLDPSFEFPSRHALTRYISSFFDGFHPHMPFIHCPTWRMQEHSLELILGIAAIGAQYCFERRSSEKLFYAGKAILMERLVHEADRFGHKVRAFLNLQGRSLQDGPDASRRDDHAPRDWAPWEPIETVRALVALMAYATWEVKVVLLQEAFALQGLLAQVLRDVGLSEEQDADCESLADQSGCQTAWLAWVRQESIRRAKLVAFSFIHTHSIAYNVYPVLRSNEINLRLPCSTKEWKAPTALQWQLVRRETRKEQLFFQDALSLLLRNLDHTAPLNPIPTPLGNYVLLHGLLQRIYIVRDLSLPIMDHSASLPAEEVEKLERGLRSWTSGWQQAAESSLDPNNENGPIPFTSSSLLGLAYVRIYLHLGPYRQLDSRDPARIAQSIKRAPAVERSNGVISALLYSVHMLSIPVRLGVDRVARSQAFFWSVRHSLSGLDCGILLSKWLTSVATSAATTPLTDSEERILHWVRCVVEEACKTVEFDDDEAHPQTSERDPAALSLDVLRIWAHFFESNTQWPFINMIGRGLMKYRELIKGS
ncbi:hypothetical protein GQ53DRAFT_702924 [Thozetella sp. PMI_491]|nr:hypothetical protein GQ53DRAFT_702924 [Thozetella sp. PMI_491]